MFKFPPDTQVCIFYYKRDSRADYTEFSTCVPFDPVPSTPHLVKVHQSSSLPVDGALSKFPGPEHAFCCPSVVKPWLSGDMRKAKQLWLCCCFARNQTCFWLCSISHLPMPSQVTVGCHKVTVNFFQVNMWAKIIFNQVDFFFKKASKERLVNVLCQKKNVDLYFIIKKYYFISPLFLDTC